ncbi:MAG: BCCT family transporter [Gammaproteobacteria bacterium]
MNSEFHNRPTVDWVIFAPTLALVLIISAMLLVYGQDAADATQSAMRFVTSHFGWLFLSAGLASVGFAIWLAFGPYGHVRFGPDDEPPEFSTPSWVAMMFTAGIGASLVAWGFAEPIFYLATPPLGIEPHSDRAIEWAHVYPLFHWGLVPWAMYAIPAVPVAYMLFVERRPYLRVSESCDAALPNAFRNATGRTIDLLIVIGILGGAATSLGVGVPLVAAFVAKLFGIDDTLGLKALVLVAWTLLFGTSCYRGLKGGIKLLADFNMLLAIVMIVFVLLVGPTLFILSLTTNSVGLLLDHFFHMALYTDPVTQSGFPEAWTVFYWAWWLAYAPMMGLFFGRISRGRTVRQVILGIIGFGSLGTCAYLAIAGGYSLHLQTVVGLDIAATIASDGMSAMVAQVISTLPLAPLTLGAFTLLSLVFYATCLDSAAYILAAICTRNLRADQEPARANRLIWAAALALIAGGVLTVGGLDAVKTGTILSALPLIPVLGLMCLSVVRRFRRDHSKLA